MHLELFHVINFPICMMYTHVSLYSRTHKLTPLNLQKYFFILSSFSTNSHNQSWNSHTINSIKKKKFFCFGIATAPPQTRYLKFLSMNIFSTNLYDPISEYAHQIYRENNRFSFLNLTPAMPIKQISKIELIIKSLWYI